MQPNNFFSLPRMQLYLQKHITDHYRFYLMGMAAIFGLTTIIPVLMVLFNGDAFTRMNEIAPIYYVGLFSGGILLTSRSFNELGSKEKGIDFLMVPASLFEKFITVLLFTTVGYFLFYHLSFYCTYKIINSIELTLRHKPIELNYQFLSNPDEKKYIYYAYFVLQAAFLLGATYFHKVSFIKTVLCIFLFGLGLYLVNCILLTFVFGFEKDMWKRGVPFLMVTKLEGGPVSWHTTAYFIPVWLQNIYLFAFSFLLAPTLWTIAFFRLKDQEI